MEEWELSYIAACIDCESCISITNNRQLVLVFASTSDRTTSWLAVRWNANIRKGKTTLAGKQTWQIAISGYRVKEILELVRPYIIEKREQVELALKFPLSKYRHSLSPEDIMTRQGISAEMKILHRKTLYD